MSKLMYGFIYTVDAVNYRVGRIIMYGIFVLMGILLWSSVSKTFFLPSLAEIAISRLLSKHYFLATECYPAL